MQRICRYIIILSLLAPAQAAFGQTPKRKYVLGIGDSISIEVWGKGGANSDFSRRQSIRMDGNITMPMLGDIQAAGLTTEMLAQKLRSKDYIGKYLLDPRVTVTLLESAGTVRVKFSGVISLTRDLPRGVTLQQILSDPDLIARLKQRNADMSAITVQSASGETFSATENIVLEWGDEIIIPSPDMPETASTPVESTPPPTPKIIFTPQEYANFVERFPDALPVLDPLLETDENGDISIDLQDIPEEQQAALGEAFGELLKMAETQIETAQFSDVKLMGINVDLRLEDALEAYLMFPPAEPGGLPVIETFKEGDIVEPGYGEKEDVVLKKILDSTKQVVLAQGESLQTLSLESGFSSITLSGILESGQGRKAFLKLANSEMDSSRKPPQRTFQEGDELGDGVKLVKIADEWILLRKDGAMQLVFLRDSLNRPRPSPPESSPEPTGTEQEDETLLSDVGEQPEAVPEGDSPAMGKQFLPQIEALNTLSKIFSATPIF